jgi:acyl phosphate:glycerol-3-phosphate acyltransferase
MHIPVAKKLPGYFELLSLIEVTSKTQGLKAISKARWPTGEGMTRILIIIGFMICGFIWGGIPTGYIVVKWIKGIDIRSRGSGNIGATNVRRVLGTPWFFGVLLLDAFKGALPILLTLQIPHLSGFERVIVAACVIGGNLFSPWLGFKGGKGIGTGLGVFIILAPIPMLVSLMVFAVFLFAFNYVSLASILAAVTLPIAIFSIESFSGINHDTPLLVFTIVVAAALISVHHTNISNIIHGTEHKFFTHEK